MNRMNKTEKKAYSWLVNKGYKDDDIFYHPRKHPNFLTNNGTNYEAKRIAGMTINFGERQFENLKKKDDKTTILAYKDESNEPVIIPMKEIDKDDMIIKGLRISLSSSLERNKKKIL